MTNKRKCIILISVIITIIDYEKETEKERNAHSLVLCTHYKDLHILFTGDMGISEETYGEEPVSVLFFPE